VTGTPSCVASRSTPRCPLIHGLSGGSNARSTPGLGARGHAQDSSAGAGARNTEATAGRSPGGDAVPAVSTSPAGVMDAGRSRTAASNAEAFIRPECRRLSGRGRGQPGYVENGSRRPPRCPSEGGACSTLDGAVCCALNACRVSGEIPPVRQASARLIQRCGGAVADYAHPALQVLSPRLSVRRIVPPAVRTPWP
jgi:hypothetical protein